jgi:hypothetical protein
MQDQQGVSLAAYEPALDTTYADLWDDLKPLLVSYEVITEAEAAELSEMLAGGD